MAILILLAVSILIPVHIARHVLSIKEVNAFKTYLCLKTRCDGKIIVTNPILQDISKQIGCSIRTVKNNLNKLTQWDWIGYNPTSDIFFIRGWKRISTLEKIEYLDKSSAIFEMNDIHQLREFLFAAVTQKIIRYKRVKYVRAAQLMTRAKQPIPTFYPLAIRYLSNVLLLSIRTIYQLKQNSFKAGYLAFKHVLIPVQFKLDDYQQLRKYSEPGSYFTIQDHQIKSRLPDLMQSNVVIVNQRKKVNKGE